LTEYLSEQVNIQHL